MKTFIKTSDYIADPSNCNNEWCSSGKGSFPATGNFPAVSQCSDYKTMATEKLKTGGISGRGIIPCPYGLLTTVPRGASGDVNEITPLNQENTNQKTGDAIFFDPHRPGWLPPTGNVRPLWRVGNEWKN